MITTIDTSVVLFVLMLRRVVQILKEYTLFDHMPYVYCITDKVEGHKRWRFRGFTVEEH